MADGAHVRRYSAFISYSQADATVVCRPPRMLDGLQKRGGK
jgi:hypothetical protein